VFIALYSPTSVQRIIDFQKTVYAFPGSIPVIIKPVGAAAQIGVPEAHRIAYKRNKPLIILPEISDLRDVLGVGKIYYVSSIGEEIDVNEIAGDEVALVISGGEHEPGKKELKDVKIVKFKNIPSSLPAIALTAILLYLTSRHTM
jgi:SpoU rRNA methylase family enzyme